MKSDLSLYFLSVPTFLLSWLCSVLLNAVYLTILVRFDLLSADFASLLLDFDFCSGRVVLTSDAVSARRFVSSSFANDDWLLKQDFLQHFNNGHNDDWNDLGFSLHLCKLISLSELCGF